MADVGVDPFNQDVLANDGYLYTTQATLSSRMANERLTKAAFAMADFRGRRVVDIGCGDGAYTIELFDQARPAALHGVDLADEAIRVARRKALERPIAFDVAGAYTLPFEADAFDIAFLRAVLHHMDDPIAALREALRVAPTVVVIEPNGYNPILKVLERVSPYHVAHHEQSYAPSALQRWIESVGGRVDARCYAGLVPFFCPDWLARLMKRLEPAVERTPGLRALGCAVCVFRVQRAGSA
jgi:ubiquinone/menaquinone biosynthesis C-methylase UbiE